MLSETTYCCVVLKQSQGLFTGNGNSGHAGTQWSFPEHLRASLRECFQQTGFCGSAGAIHAEKLRPVTAFSQACQTDEAHQYQPQSCHRNISARVHEFVEVRRE